MNATKIKTTRGILAGWLADGSGRALSREQFIEIRDGRILGIRPADETDRRAPRVIDWSDGMVIPGLIDAHVHLFMSAGFSTAEAIRCATANGADLLALPDLGELAPGRQATLVALQGGPAQFPHNLAVPVIMVSAGRVVYDNRV